MPRVAAGPGVEHPPTGPASRQALAAGCQHGGKAALPAAPQAAQVAERTEFEPGRPLQGKYSSLFLSLHGKSMHLSLIRTASDAVACRPHDSHMTMYPSRTAIRLACTSTLQAFTHN